MGFAVAGIVALAATGVAAWALLRAPQPAPESRYVLDLPSGHRLARPVSMTRLDPLPDGRGFVYVGADSTGVERLWVRSRDRLGATTLPGTVGAGNPSVSPDGTRVAFNSSGEAQLLVASLGGGSPVLVEDSLVDYGGISWGDDGYIYYDGHLEGDGLARVPEGGGTPEPVTMSGFEAGELWHFQPSALPGGRGVLFVIRRPTSHDVAVVDLETGEHEVLVSGAVAPRFSSSGHLLYATEEGTLMAAPFDPVGLTVTGVARPVADGVQIFGLGRAEVGVDDTGRLMYVEGRGAGFFELVWVSRDGTVEAVDPQQDPGDYSEPALSPDGDRLAFTVDGQDGLQIWIREIPSGPTTRFTFEGQSWMPTWSADGSHLAFVSVRPEGRGSANRPGNQAVYRRRADGSAPAELLHDPGGAQINTLGYSPDGRWLLFDANADLYALSLDEDGRPGEGEPLLVSGDDRAGELAGQVSPDGRWVAFRSDQGGQNAVYVCPFPSSCEVRHLVTGSDGGSYPRWSRSGEELFYRSYRGVERPIMSVEILPGPTFRWGGVSELFSASDLRAGGSRGIYDVTDDGQRFVFPRRAGAGEVERVVIVENVLRGF